MSRSRSRLGLKIESLGLVSVSNRNVSFTSLHYAVVRSKISKGELHERHPQNLVTLKSKLFTYEIV